MKTTVYSQKDVINRTLTAINQGRSEYSKMQYEELEQYINAFEMAATTCLKEAYQPDTAIDVKLFKGLKLSAKYTPATIRKMYGKEITTEPKISAKAKLSNYFRYAKLNESKGA